MRANASHGSSKGETKIIDRKLIHNFSAYNIDLYIKKHMDTWKLKHPEKKNLKKD